MKEIPPPCLPEQYQDPGWHERGVEEAAYIKQIDPDLHKDGG